MHYPGLEGKNALLIGGHSNIGQHVTSLFAQAGANVIIGARDMIRAQQVASEARRFNKGNVTAVNVDATDARSVETAVKKILELGNLDVVYHGIAWAAPGRSLDLDSQDWDALYERNFKSVLTAFKLVLPIMKEQRSGCFIVMGSALGRRPMAAIEPVYGAMKCALTHVAQCLALELGPYGVRINVVAPGPAAPTDFSAVSANSAFRHVAEHMEEFKSTSKRFAEEIPLRRLGEPENVAHAVLYFASPITGAFQTGQVLGVDGGWWMPR